MPDTLHRKRRRTTSSSRGARILLTALLGLAILCGVVFVIVKAIPEKPEDIAETPPPPIADTYIDEEGEETAGNMAFHKTPENPATETAMDSALFSALAKLGAPKGKLRIRNLGKIEGIGGEIVEITANISKAFPMAMANHTVQSAWKSAGGEIIDAIETAYGRRVVVEAGVGGIVTRKIIIRREYSGKPPTGTVALMIDDFGIHPFDEINGFLEIDIPFTATVIPFEDYTEETVDILSKNGVELMVHMPMEPESYPRNDPGKHAIYIKLPPDEIKKRIRAAIENIPLAVGMNNHMGSKATAHKRTMEIVAGALVESGLFFVDSRTSLYSCAEQEVAKRGIPTTHQDGNIDVESDTSAIARRFIELALSSRENDNGALIVGHARPNTLIAIKRVLPTLEKWGIEFITVSEMVSRRQKEN